MRPAREVGVPCVEDLLLSIENLPVGCAECFEDSEVNHDGRTVSRLVCCRQALLLGTDSDGVANVQGDDLPWSIRLLRTFSWRKFRSLSGAHRW